ncbi:ABC transporter permease [Kineosporia babensis]
MDAVADTSGGAVAPGSDADSASRKEHIVRTVFLFVIPFLMITMMFATYMGTMHSPHPRDLPVAVIGNGAEAESIKDALSGDAVEARSVPTREAAVDLLRDQEIVAALQPPANSGEPAAILTASAAGASQAATARQLLTPVAVAANWTVVSDEVAPLPDGDQAGISVMFAAMGMMLAGYVPLSIMLQNSPQLLRLRRFLPVMLGWAVATSTIIWLIQGPIVGAIDGHYLVYLGVGLLATSAVGLAQLLFSKILGPLAVLLGMLLWVSFGMPSSNLAMSIHTMPEFFQFLHGVLPLPAAGEALRAALYFDGRGVGAHLAVLGVWIAASIVLILLRERSASGKTAPGAPPLDAELPALAGGPIRSKRFRYATLVAFPLSILVVVVGLMSFAMHKPTPHDIPVVVIGTGAEQTAAGLNAQMDKILDVKVADSVDQAVEDIRAQEIVAAFELPTSAQGPATLYSSSAAGSSQQMMVQAIFGQIAAAQQMQLQTDDVTPLHDSDTMGSNSMYVGMSWIMSGFLLLAVLRGGAPHLRRFRQFLPHLAGWAIGMSVWLWFLFDVLIGAVSAPVGQLIGFGAITIFSVSLATAVFTRLFGIAAIVPVMVVLMMAGVPASGGGLSLYMVPEFFRSLHDVLPLAAAVDIARSLVYFDGVGTGQNLATLGIWAAAGVVLNVLVDQYLERREQAQEGRAEIAEQDQELAARV